MKTITQSERPASKARLRAIPAVLAYGFLACLPLSSQAQQEDAESESDTVPELQEPGTAPASSQDEDTLLDLTTYRLSPIRVSTEGVADDDDDSIVATELWVGGKVATSVLDTPASVSIVTAEEIEQRDADTLEEVLQYSPGVLTDYYGTDDRNDYFQVRGFQATTYRDGLTLGSMRGVREEPFAFERVEVIKGANSTLFGTADPGGSVNFVTKLPRAERFGEAFLVGGSFDHLEAGFDVGDAVSEDSDVSYRFTGKLQDSELEYDYSEDDETFLMGGLTWEPGVDTSVSVVADYLDRDGTPNSGGYPRGGDYERSLFFGEPDFNFHDVERSTLSAILEHEFGSDLTLRANFRYSDLTDDYGYVYIAGTDEENPVGRGYLASDSTAEEVIGDVIMQYDRSFGNTDSSTLAGLEFRDASTQSTSYYAAAESIDTSDPVYFGAPETLDAYASQTGDSQTQALFLQQNLSFVDRIVATVGFRHDKLELSETDRLAETSSSDDFSENSVRGALTYKVNGNVSTYVSYAESVAPPSIGVDPERGEQVELGVKFKPAGSRALFAAAIYDLTKKNETIPVVLEDNTIDRQVLGETRVRGLDLEGKAEFENISLLANYSFMDTEIIQGAVAFGDSFTDYAGNAISSAPEHMASVWLNYTLDGKTSRGDMTFGLGVRYIGSYYFNDANDSGKSKNTSLFDASWNYQILSNADVSLNVANLADEQHVVGSGTADYYNPGRSFAAKIRYHW